MSDKHWDECWRYASHHACAVAEVERLRAALEEVLEEAAYEITPRRPFYDDLPDGLMESDRDFVNNNFDACVAFLDRAMVIIETAARGALGEEREVEHEQKIT